jgi:hypothetical protein
MYQQRQHIPSLSNLPYLDVLVTCSLPPVMGILSDTSMLGLALHLFLYILVLMAFLVSLFYPFYITKLQSALTYDFLASEFLD